MADGQTIVSTNIRTAAEMLAAGQIVAFPTETVYGLGADAENPVAVARIFESKGRPTFDPLIVHVPDVAAARGLTLQFSELAKELAAAFWPGPLTLVLPKSPRIPDLVTAGLPGVGLRVPNHSVAQKLLQTAQRPIAAPSANRFGCISPTTADHVLDGLNGRIDGVLDGGPTTVGLESTVVSLMADVPVLLRPGGLPAEDIEAITGPIQRATSDPSKDDSAQPSPGMLSRHYSPGTALQICGKEAVNPIPGRRCGLLTHGPHSYAEGFEQVEQLSEDGDLRTCAAKFFAALRSLDSRNLDVIIARRFPPRSLGVALNDRLERAATK